jgi:hypothetical protein
MVAVLPPLLSDQPPEVPQKVGLGDRFHYFRGVSGRRYLFSTVTRGDLADFTSAVVILARRTANGRLAAYWIATLDATGRPTPGRWPHIAAANEVVLVHLLAETETARRDLIADLAPAPAFALAA